MTENNTLTGEPPDRNATCFNKTPQGSSFDGLEKFEKTKMNTTESPEEHSNECYKNNMPVKIDELPL